MAISFRIPFLRLLLLCLFYALSSYYLLLETTSSSWDFLNIGTAAFLPTQEQATVWQQLTANTSCSLSQKESEDEAFFLIPEEPNLSMFSDFERKVSPEICLPTSQVKVIQRCPHWELEAFDVNGQPKNIGGDEFYVTYQHHGHSSPTAVARIEDMNNGRYLLHFKSSPLNHRYHRFSKQKGGTVTITFQYTCGIGSLAPPAKHNWESGGATVFQHSLSVPNAPQIVPFKPPISFLDNRHNTSSIRFVAFGDSLMQHFVKPLNMQIPNIGKPLNNSTAPEWIDLFQRKVDPQIKLIASSVNDSQVVLLVGSSVWDLLTASKESKNQLDDHQLAMTKFIKFLQKTYPDSRKVRIAWKSPTALHVHVPLLENQSNTKRGHKFRERLKYMSAARSFEIYQVQKRLCQDFEIDFLDVFEASYLSSDHALPGDGRHFSEDFNSMSLAWFVSRGSVEHLWDHLYARITVDSKRLLVSKHCDSWLDICNAIVVALVTNRRLVWQHPCAIAKDLEFETFEQNETFAQNMLAPESQESEAPQKKLTSRKILMLEETMSNVVSKNLLVARELISGDVASASNQFAEQIFFSGAKFLYGMILYHILKLPGNSIRLSTPDAAVVFAVHDPSGNSDIRRCMDELSRKLTAKHETLGNHPNCQVLFSSNQASKKWERMLRKDYNCTAIDVVAGSNDDGGKPWRYAKTVADSSFDGYIGPCFSPVDELFDSLVVYIRSKNARSEGVLPLQELPKCCLS